MKEPIFELFLRRMRIGKVLDEVRKIPDCHLLDIGCGYNHKFLSTIEPYIAKGVGIDFKVPEIRTDKLITIQKTLNNKLPFDDKVFDMVTMLAVLEHLDKPINICSEIMRILKHNGKLVLTVPSKFSKPILEFLAFKMRLINSKEVIEHKKYYDLYELNKLVARVDGLMITQHKYFQFGMNNFCVIVKVGECL